MLRIWHCIQRGYWNLSILEERIRRQSLSEMGKLGISFHLCLQLLCVPEKPYHGYWSGMLSIGSDGTHGSEFFSLTYLTRVGMCCIPMMIAGNGRLLTGQPERFSIG